MTLIHPMVPNKFRISNHHWKFKIKYTVQQAGHCTIKYILENTWNNNQPGANLSHRKKLNNPWWHYGIQDGHLTQNLI